MCVLHARLMFTGMLLVSGSALAQPDHLVCLVPDTLGIFDTLVRNELVSVVHLKFYMFTVYTQSTILNSTGFTKQMLCDPAVPAGQLAGSFSLWHSGNCI